MQTRRSIMGVFVVFLLLVLVDPFTALLAQEPYLPSSAVNLMTVSNDGHFVAINTRAIPGEGSSNGFYYPIDVYDLTDGHLVASIGEVWIAPNSIDFSPDNQYLVFSTNAGNVEVAEISGQQIISSLASGGVISASGADWNPVTNEVSFYIGDSIYIGNLDTNSDFLVIEDSESRGAITSTAWSTNGNMLASTTYSPEDDVAQIQIWSMEDEDRGSLVRRFIGGGNDSLAWSPDNSLIATPSRGAVVIYDIGSGQELASLPTGPNSFIFDVAFSPDGQRLAAGGLNSLWTWDVNSQQLIEHIETVGRVNSISWTSDSAHIVHNGGTEGIYLDGEPLSEILATSPSIVINQSAIQSDPTNTAPISFTVQFSEPVTGFDASDIDLSASTAPGTLTAVVTGSGANYTVEVSGMTGDGTVVANVPANAAQNAAGVDNSASTSTDNSVTYDATAPLVTVNQATTQADPGTNPQIRFTAVFSEPVTGFDESDINIFGTSGAAKAVVTGSGTTYTIKLSGMTSDGTVRATIFGGAALDAAGNTSTASTSTDNTVTYDGPYTNGLYGEYYDDAGLSAFVFGRVDSTINFNWGDGSPDPRIGVDSYTVRWTDQVLPQYSETYTFYVTYNDGVRLWVDNPLLISDFVNGSTRSSSGTIALTAGEKVNIRLEFLESGGDRIECDVGVAKCESYPADHPQQPPVHGRAEQRHGVASDVL